MYRSNTAATTDSRATESSTKTGYFSDMDSQRVHSEKTNYGPNQQRFPSPFESVSMSQNNRNRNVLTPMENARSEMNRPLFQYNYAPAESSSGAIDKPWRQQPVTTFMTPDWNAQSTYPDRLAITNGSGESEDEFDEVDGYEPFSQLRRPPVQLQMHHSQAVPMSQYVYSRAIPTVAELKSNPLWNRILSNSDSAGPSTTVMAPKWKSAPYGNKKTGRDQFASTNQSYTQSFNSDKSFDALAESESFNSMALAKTLLAKSEKDVEMERYMLMKSMKRRPRVPLLTRYSPEVLCEIDANTTDLLPLSTSVSSTRETVNQEPSSSFNNSPQSSNKEVISVKLNPKSRHDVSNDSNFNLQLNKTGDEALRPQASPAELQEPETASTQGENSVTPQSDKEHTTLPDSNDYTEGVSSSTVTCAESQPQTPANESTVTDRNAEITNLQNATTVNETQAAMQPLKLVDSPVATVIENENISSQESQKDIDDSISVPAAPQSDASNDLNHSRPALSEDCHNKPIGETMYATPSVSPATFIHPMNIINEETPLECPQNVDSSTAMIPVTSQSDALNEAIMFGSVATPNLLDHCYIIPLQETVFTTPPPLSPAQYIFPIDSNNAPIEQTIFWPMQNAQQNMFPDMGIPTAPFTSTPAGLPDGKTVEVTPQLPQTTSVIPPSEKSSLETPNIIQTSNVIPPTTSKPKSSENSKERRPYNRKNKVQIQSNEMIVAPPVSPMTGAPSNNNVQINPQQAIGDQKPSNIASPIQMPSKSALNLPIKSDVTPSNPLKRKNPDNLQASNKAKLPKANGTGANSTKTSAATLKRKNKENLPPNVPVKSQKMDNSAQATNKYSAGNLLTANLPDITIQRVGQNVKNTIGGASRQNSEDRLLFDTIQKLQRNGVSVFRIPPTNVQQQQLLKVQQKPSNPVMDKYKKVFKMNNVSIERLN